MSTAMYSQFTDYVRKVMYSTNVTDNARKVMQSVNEIANSFGHSYISTAHVLVALLRGPHSVAWNVLNNLGVDMTELDIEAVETLKEATNDKSHVALSDPPRAKCLIKCAKDQSRELGHNYVGTEHLLLGMLDEGEGLAAQLLNKRKITLSGTRDEVNRLLGKSPFAIRRV